MVDDSLKSTSYIFFFSSFSGLSFLESLIEERDDIIPEEHRFWNNLLISKSGAKKGIPFEPVVVVPVDSEEEVLADDVESVASEEDTAGPDKA